jgi:hypothetical protein
MYSVNVVLRKLTCFDTESIHSSDKFALSGAIIGDSGEPIGIYLPVMRINDGEARSIDQVYSLSTDNPNVGISLIAWDIDEGDSWKESEDDIKTAINVVKEAVKLVPQYGTVASSVISAVSSAVIGAINIFNDWDKDDKLLQFSEIVNFTNSTPYVMSSATHKIHFSGGDPSGYSSWEYELELEIQHTWQPSLFPQTPPVSAGAKAAEVFRMRAGLAAASGFLGAFPNFYSAPRGLGFVSGTIFVTGAAAEWRDVPLAELGGVSLDDFEGRMRATNAYATKNGFTGGFPNYFHADYGNGIVCGTILLKSSGAEWRDVPLSELGDPELSDFEARFRATHDYANRNGFVGGFPNLFHAEKQTRDFRTGRPIRQVVCGTVLLRPDFIDFRTGRRSRVAEWRDV